MQGEILLHNRFSISLRKFLESYIYVLNSGPSIKKDITEGSERPFSTLVYIKMHMRQGCNLQQKVWDAVGMSCARLGGANEGWQSWEAAPTPPDSAREFSHSCSPLFFKHSPIPELPGHSGPHPKVVLWHLPAPSSADRDGAVPGLGAGMKSAQFIPKCCPGVELLCQE